MPKAKSDVHITPKRVYERIEEIWFLKKYEMFDPCPVNPDFDGLKIPWRPYNYVNPPYPQIQAFVDKALDELSRSHQSIMLLPSTKTDQTWFHQLWERKFRFEWFLGRLIFEGEKSNAPGPHFLVMVRLDRMG